MTRSRPAEASDGSQRVGGVPERQGLDWARLVELASVLLATVVAVLSLWFSNHQVSDQMRISREELRNGREGWVTDRYTAAVGNLGDDAVDVRLGGIYALQRIMEDSPRDHPTIANVLATYIRLHASTPPKVDRQVAPDVLAALDVISSRNSVHDRSFVPDLRSAHLPGVELGQWPSDRKPAQLRRAILRRADLSDADLSGADLRGARLASTNLANADLRDADLREATPAIANLRGADLSDADLRKADLRGSDLRDADLIGTDLRGAILYRTKLVGLTLSEADLDGADLKGADLTDAAVATTQILTTQVDSRTKLPPRIANDSDVRARIAEVEAEDDGI
ncbi:pentapeptide repeat-containing protein [Streptomyces sp. NBC_01283]|uniref:pentapeptide repeat-containing protein n=1 Tax=Streptomyces sp. NBC_01283 TaxID=2903812 RepID=UPI00352D6E21|nr:pentapeptide repeat-containing protein [Streptomyces sp. NBC_01283]